jgi:hypothetical protein
MKLFTGKTLMLGGCLALLTISVASCCCTTPKTKTVELFDGKSLDGWQYALADASVGRDQVWSVENGILKCKGDPIGVLYKGPEVTDFDLEVEYRWAPGQTPGNSGIFSRIERPATPPPKAIEIQLKHGSAGDVMGLRGKVISADQERSISIKAHPVAGDISGVSKLQDAEKAPGEWNKVLLKARGDVYTVYVNGKLVNEAKGVDVSRGPVGVQSEGGEVHYRRVALTPLK